MPVMIGRIAKIALLASSLLCGCVLANDSCDTLVIPPGVGVGSPADVTAFNPLLVNSLYNQHVGNYLMANLLWIGHDGQIDFSHSIASKIDVFDNGQRYRITMRPWLWSDGVPVTADDVVYEWELIKGLGENFTGYGQGGIPTMVKSFVALNAEQFEVTLTRPVNPDWFELGGLSALAPLPQHVWGKMTTDELYIAQSNPDFFKVVSGPYKIASFDMGRSISFVPNPLYPLEHPAVSRLVEKFMNSGGAELQGLQSGELDMANLPPESIAAVSSIPNIHLAAEKPSFAINFMGLNLHNPATPFFQDVRVRQAIADAIDQKAMIKAIWHGYGVEAYGPVPSNPATYLSPDARAGKFPVGYDPAKAAALLDAAGYKPGPDGIRVKNGVRLQFTVLIPTGTNNEVMQAQFIQPALRKIGIQMNIQMEEFNQMMATMWKKVAPWQAYILITSLGAYPSGEVQFITGGIENWGGYSDPKMDQYVNDSMYKPGLNALYQFEDYASEQPPVIFLPMLTYVVLERKWWHGVENMITPGNGYNPQLLTINKGICEREK